MFSLLGNLIWFILGGGVIGAIAWAIAGVIMALSIIGLPFSFACFRYASFMAFPFGKDLVDARAVGEGRVVGTSLANLVWVLFAGIWLSLFHLFWGFLCIITIVGIPFGLAHFKLASIAFAPLGKRIVANSGSAFI